MWQIRDDNTEEVCCWLALTRRRRRRRRSVHIVVLRLYAELGRLVYSNDANNNSQEHQNTPPCCASSPLDYYNTNIKYGTVVSTKQNELSPISAKGRPPKKLPQRKEARAAEYFVSLRKVRSKQRNQSSRMDGQKKKNGVLHSGSRSTSSYHIDHHHSAAPSSLSCILTSEARF